MTVLFHGFWKTFRHIPDINTNPAAKKRLGRRKEGYELSRKIEAENIKAGIKGVEKHHANYRKASYFVEQQISVFKAFYFSFFLLKKLV